MKKQLRESLWDLDLDLGSIFDVVKKGFEAAEVAVRDIRSVVEALNGVRSVVVTVGNNTSKEFQLLRTHHDHGDFATNPIGIIKPREFIVFGSQNRGGSIATGTEGKRDLYVGMRSYPKME